MPQSLQTDPAFFAQRLASLLCINIEALRSIFYHPYNEVLVVVVTSRTPSDKDKDEDTNLCWKGINSNLESLFDKIKEAHLDDHTIHKHLLLDDTRASYRYLCDFLTKNPPLADAFATTCTNLWSKIEDFYENHQPKNIKEERSAKLKKLQQKLLGILDNYSDHLNEQEQSLNDISKAPMIAQKQQAISELRAKLLDGDDTTPSPPIFKNLCAFSAELSKQTELLSTHINSIGSRFMKGIANIFLSIFSLGLPLIINYRQGKSCCFWRTQGRSTTIKLTHTYRAAAFSSRK